MFFPKIQTFLKIAFTASTALILSSAEVAFAGQDLGKEVQNSLEYKNGWGFDEAGMNRSISPGNDFFSYANGHYIANLHIPKDASSFGPFRILYQLSQQRQKNILEEALKHQDEKTEFGKLGRYYGSFLDQNHVDMLGAMPLKEDLAHIHAVKNNADLAQIFGQAAHSFMFSTFVLDIEYDQRDPRHYMLLLDQGMSIGVSGGLGLPDISYYTNPKLAAQKEAYRAYIVKILTLLGEAVPTQKADALLTLETDLAKVELPRDQTRDPLKIFNPMKIRDLEKLAPEMDWKTLLLAMGVPEKGLEEREIDVREPKNIALMSHVLAHTKIETLQAWLAFHLADNAAPYLSHEFTDASFAFHGKALNGILEEPVRWKRGVSVTNAAMGWALGRLYVERYFPLESEQKITVLTQEVKSAFADRLEKNTWMDAQTKKEALNKLAHFEIQVGYPHKWWDYTPLEIVKGDVYGNAVRSIAFNWHHRLERLDKAVDRDEWDMTPQTVNAYNDPSLNEIVFPAAILQPPFFDAKADMAVNYGAIGGVIGHEMSHGFDDQGRHYDAYGRLHDWWSAQSAHAFTILAQKLGKEYDQQEILPGLHVNGTMTMGENIADLGGLNLALEAYHNDIMHHHGGKDILAHGLTGDQRVFLGWAQAWREKDRPDALRTLVLSNEHAPAQTRVNMPAHNIDDWYKAFNVQPGQKLYLAPEQRVKIW